MLDNIFQNLNRIRYNKISMRKIIKMKKKAKMINLIK